MNASTRHKWDLFEHYEHARAPWPYVSTMDVGRSLGGFMCCFEVTIKRWTQNAHEPEIECVSAVQAFNSGGQECTNPATLNTLNTLAEQYAKDNVEDLCQEMDKKKGRE